MSNSRSKDLLGLENRLRDVYVISMRVFANTVSLANVKDDATRNELGLKIEEDVALLDILKREVSEIILAYTIRYQPLGKDFRKIHTFLDVLYDVYRVGRYCREIMLVDKHVKKLSDESLRELRDPLKLAREAYENAYQALFNECKKCLERVQEIDDIIDELYMSYLREIGGKETLPNSAVAKALILRHIERIVDHAVNIASYRFSYS
ncbi:MAG: phosphate uptake regulator PhoU [Zestosphaera sp.]